LRSYDKCPKANLRTTFTAGSVVIPASVVGSMQGTLLLVHAQATAVSIVIADIDPFDVSNVAATFDVETLFPIDDNFIT
jgi:hypothetical protein